MTVYTETIGYQVMSELGILSSLGKFCQRFSIFVTDSWRWRVFDYLMDRQTFIKAEFDKTKARSENFFKNYLSLNPEINLFM